MVTRNTGKPSEAIFMENVSGLVFRLRDKADLVGLNKGKNVAAFGNPSDYLLIQDDGMYFAEVKSSTNKTSFSISGFTSAQTSAIYKCAKRGYGNRYRIYVHCLETDIWYLMNADDFLNLIQNNRKSIKWSELNTLTSW